MEGEFLNQNDLSLSGLKVPFGIENGNNPLTENVTSNRENIMWQQWAATLFEISVFITQQIEYQRDLAAFSYLQHTKIH